MNKVETFPPATGSRDTAAPTQAPSRSGAARRSRGPEPSHVLAVINRRISEALTDYEFETMNENEVGMNYHASQATALVFLKRELFGMPDEAEGRVNDQGMGRRDAAPPQSDASPPSPSPSC